LSFITGCLRNVVPRGNTKSRARKMATLEPELTGRNPMVGTPIQLDPTGLMVLVRDLAAMTQRTAATVTPLATLQLGAEITQPMTPHHVAAVPREVGVGFR